MIMIHPLVVFVQENVIVMLVQAEALQLVQDGMNLLAQTSADHSDLPAHLEPPAAMLTPVLLTPDPMVLNPQARTVWPIPVDVVVVRILADAWPTTAGDVVAAEAFMGKKLINNIKVVGFREGIGR